jgi:hypothetical protein
MEALRPSLSKLRQEIIMEIHINLSRLKLSFLILRSTIAQNLYLIMMLQHVQSISSNYPACTNKFLYSQVERSLPYRESRLRCKLGSLPFQFFAAGLTASCKNFSILLLRIKIQYAFGILLKKTSSCTNDQLIFLMLLMSSCTIKNASAI